MSLVRAAAFAIALAACTSPSSSVDSVSHSGRRPVFGGTTSPAKSAPPTAKSAPPTPAKSAAPRARGGNLRIPRFDEAKKALRRIYAEAGHRVDLYCGCSFLPRPGRGLRVDLAGCGYVPARDAKRAARIEWEHAVPAAAFGHTFAEWRAGSPRCKTKKGRRFKGRRCARVASPEFARMEADLHNLFPVVGEVNGLRGDLPMGLVEPTSRVRHHGGRGSFHFGRCKSAVERGVFTPRPEVRGDVARAYKYMDASYPGRGIIGEAHRALFDAWDAADPPDAWERERNRLIEARQGNRNPFIR